MPESMSSLSFTHGTTTNNNMFAFHCASGLINPLTRVPFELLGPCYKTGRIVNAWSLKARSLPSTTSSPQRGIDHFADKIVACSNRYLLLKNHANS